MADPLVKSNLTQADYFKDIVGTIREPLLVLDASLRVLGANRSFYKFFKVKAGETIGKLVYDLGNSQWDIPGLRLLLETILPQKAAFHDYNVEHDFPIIGRRILLLNARRISRLPNKAAWILLAFEDVTERMELERKLQASEERFRHAFDTAQDGMLLIEKTGGKILNSNQSAENMLGYSKRSLRKKNLWDLGILKDKGQFRQTSFDLEEWGVVDLVDKTIPTRRGGNIPADIYLMDRAAVIQCNIRNISARKQSEGAIHDLARFPTENPNPVMRIDRGGILLYANEAALVQLADWKLGLGNQVTQVLNDPIHEVFKTGTTNTVELICGGRIFSIAIGHTPEGNDVNIYGVDITERKQAEEALQIAYKRLQEAQRIGKLGSVDWNLVTDEVILSDETRKLLGWGQENKTIFMKELIDLIKPEEKDRVRKSIYDAQAVRPLVDLEMGLVRPNGKEITVHMIAELIPDPQGRPLRMVGTLQDVTERKAAGDKIRQLNADLEQRVEERTRELHKAQEELMRKEKLAVLGQLAGGVGHELRNPLGVISNSVYYLAMVQPDADEKIKKYHAMIEQELHNATRIVGDLIDYAREITTEPQPASVTELVEHTLSHIPVPASISIKIRIPADLPQVYADPLHVEQILGNLVTNACQVMATPSLDTMAGSATMSGRCKLTISAHFQKKMVAIAVKDAGTGILPENLPKLFEPLFSTKVTDIGLGLAVSKKLAEANGGRIEVKSRVGKGSTFTLYLPVVG